MNNYSENGKNPKNSLKNENRSLDIAKSKKNVKIIELSWVDPEADQAETKAIEANTIYTFEEFQADPSCGEDCYVEEFYPYIRFTKGAALPTYLGKVYPTEIVSAFKSGDMAKLKQYQDKYGLINFTELFTYTCWKNVCRKLASMEVVASWRRCA